MNIIILAAGQGTRLNGTDYEGVPKSLIRMINGQSSLERLLDILLDNRVYNNIDNIYIVTGYKSSLFEYCNIDPKIEIIYNHQYDKPSNQYSFLMLKDYPIKDSIIIDADTFIIDKSVLIDIINYNFNNSVVTCDKLNSDNEWVVQSNGFEEINKIEDNDNNKSDHITSGIVTIKSYTMIDIFKYLDDNEVKYWDDYYKKYYAKHSFTEKYYSGLNRILEIDTVSDINNINTVLRRGKIYYENNYNRL